MSRQAPVCICTAAAEPALRLRPDRASRRRWVDHQPADLGGEHQRSAATTHGPWKAVQRSGWSGVLKAPSPVRAHPGPCLARLPISIGRADGHLGIGYRGTDRDAGRNRSVPTSCADHCAPRAIEDDLASENVRSWGKETSDVEQAGRTGHGRASASATGFIEWKGGQHVGVLHVHHAQRQLR